MIDTESTPEASAEPRTLESRDGILRAATKLFATRGFHETSMAEVARAAKVSKALIFWHFKTKEELFLAVLSRLLEPYVIDFAEEAGALDERAQILKLIESYLGFVTDNAASIRFFVAQLLHNEQSSSALTQQILTLYKGYQALLTDLIAKTQCEGLCRQSSSPASIVAFLLATLNGLLIGYLFLGNHGLELESAAAMLREWLFGASAPS